ncbi:hypothetical protein CaCOL14_001971 [Colletotrichum acutatum]
MTQDPVSPSPIEIAHLGLRTPNPTPLITFYKTLLNAHIVLQNNYISVLTWDREHHRLAILHSPTPSTSPSPSSSSNDTALPPSNDPPPSTGLDHIALKFASLNDLARMYHAGKAGGIEPHLCLNHGVTTSLYYRDPDGNQIETMIENYDNPEDVWKHMNRLDPSNTRGVRFDPKDLLRL